MRQYSVLVLLALAGCATVAPDEKKPIGMPNPASVYCQEQGGRLEIRSGAGGQSGYCHLPDGRVVEEWEFYRARDPERKRGR